LERSCSLKKIGKTSLEVFERIKSKLTGENMNACFGLSLPGKEQSRIKIIGWKANPEQP